jgi:hypothetical protein
MMFRWCRKYYDVVDKADVPYEITFGMKMNRSGRCRFCDEYCGNILVLCNLFDYVELLLRVSSANYYDYCTC